MASADDHRFDDPVQQSATPTGLAASAVG